MEANSQNNVIAIFKTGRYLVVFSGSPDVFLVATSATKSRPGNYYNCYCIYIADTNNLMTTSLRRREVSVRMDD